MEVCNQKIEVGMKVRYYESDRIVEGVVGEIGNNSFYIWQNEHYGIRGTKNLKGFTASWCVPLTCTGRIEILKGGIKMKRIWEVIVVDKTKNEIIMREIVIDGDEKSACSKVSIKFSDKLKDLVFDNLCYIAKELGSYESKEKSK